MRSSTLRQSRNPPGGNPSSGEKLQRRLTPAGMGCPSNVASEPEAMAACNPRTAFATRHSLCAGAHDSGRVIPGFVSCALAGHERTNRRTGPQARPFRRAAPPGSTVLCSCERYHVRSRPLSRARLASRCRTLRPGSRVGAATWSVRILAISSGNERHCPAPANCSQECPAA